MADLCLWSPAFFGVKPDLVLKMGMIAAAPMGDPNASIPTPQPVHYRPMFGAFGGALANCAVTFLSKSAHEGGLRDLLALQKTTLPVEDTRGIGKADMVLNDACPEIELRDPCSRLASDNDDVPMPCVSFDDAAKAFSAAGADCAQLCKALHSMTHATDRLCDLTQGGPATDQQR